VISKDDTTMVEGDGKKADVEARVAQIRREIENSDSDWDREKLSERLAKLAGGVAIIKVGAATEVELKERKHRIEDAIQATRAAVEEGILPGGGVSLLHSSAAIEKLRGGTDDEKAGRQIVLKSLESPLRQISVNAGYEGGVIVEHVKGLKGSTEGFNAQTGIYEDLMKAGVIDPAKVTRSTLQNAASIAGLLITTEAIVAEEAEEAPPAMPGGGGDMHGMMEGIFGIPKKKPGVSRRVSSCLVEAVCIEEPALAPAHFLSWLFGFLRRSPAVPAGFLHVRVGWRLLSW
ncbi:MAG: TCP-1/cpn60 chaperonin family protein, partial [Acidimicrobiia bacterium]